VTSQPPTPRDFVATHWPGQLTQFYLGQLFVRKSAPADAAEPAVMIHGLGGQATNWTDFMHAMSPRLESWAPDLPGFGRSPGSTSGDYSFDALMSSTAAVVEMVVTARRQPVHLFGNSLGGALCVRLAAEHPDWVRSLVLTSPALPDLRPRRHTVGVPVIALPRVGERVWRRLGQLPSERHVQAMIDLNYGDPSRVSAVRREEAAAEYRRRFALSHSGESLSKTARGLLQAFAERGPRALWAQAARLQMPSLVLYGGRDRLVNPKRAIRVAKTFPKCRVVVLPRVGHVAQMEVPELVAHFVNDFLDSLPAGQGDG